MGLNITSAAMALAHQVVPRQIAQAAVLRVSSEERPRLHDVAFDNEGHIWVVTGNNSKSYTEGKTD